MHPASCIISLCLHAAVFLMIWFWPQASPLRLDVPPIMISLVEGAPGGNRAPSPILGQMGETSSGSAAPAPPAPQSEIAAREREEIKTPEPKSIPAQEREAPPKPMRPEPVVEKKPDPPKIEEKPVEAKKPEPEKPKLQKTETVKKEAPKPEPKKTEKPKPAPKKQTPKADPIATALQQARRATSRVSSGDRGNAVEQALAQARKNAGGNRGGGGGEGEGPGGGGLGDVYMGQVMLAVRPNWGFASPGRKSLVCVVRVQVDMQGKVLKAEISQSSGNAQYDASAVNAVVRTSQAGEFPPPPNQAYCNLDLVFTLDELMGR